MFSTNIGIDLLKVEINVRVIHFRESQRVSLSLSVRIFMLYQILRKDTQYAMWNTKACDINQATTKDICIFEWQRSLSLRRKSIHSTVVPMLVTANGQCRRLAKNLRNSVIETQLKLYN